MGHYAEESSGSAAASAHGQHATAHHPSAHPAAAAPEAEAEAEGDLEDGPAAGGEHAAAGAHKHAPEQGAAGAKSHSAPPSPEHTAPAESHAAAAPAHHAAAEHQQTATGHPAPAATTGAHAESAAHATEHGTSPAASHSLRSTAGEGGATVHGGATVQSAGTGHTADAGHHAAAHTSAEKKPKAFYAKQDIYNRPEVVNNKVQHTADKDADKTHNANLMERPGVRLNGHDKYKLNAIPSPRYLVVSGMTAKKIDVIDEKSDIAVQVAHSRPLKLDGAGEAVDCVLVWYRGAGAAWMPISALKVDATVLKQTVNADAKRLAPAVAQGETTRYKFRSSVPVQGDEQTRLGPHQKGTADLLKDYLLHKGKSTKLSTEDPSTHNPRDKTDPLYGESKRDFYNVNLSLRSANAAVVAIDTAEPGQYFFIPKAKKFTRLAGSYETNAATANKKIKWVYGFLGKEENGKWVADHSRRGWVPQRVVELSPETGSHRNA